MGEKKEDHELLCATTMNKDSMVFHRLKKADDKMSLLSRGTNEPSLSSARVSCAYCHPSECLEQLADLPLRDGPKWCLGWFSSLWDPNLSDKESISSGLLIYQSSHARNSNYLALPLYTPPICPCQTPYHAAMRVAEQVLPPISRSAVEGNYRHYAPPSGFRFLTWG